MAKLSDIKWHKKGKTEDGLSFTSTVTVDSDGIFLLSIPECLVDIGRSLSIGSSFIHKKHRISSKTLDEGKNNIARMIDEYLSCDVSTRLVILYDYIASCHYAKDLDGVIHPNGYCCKDSYKWNNTVGSNAQMSHMTTPSDYSVGFKAAVMLKTTYKRGASEKTKYVLTRDDRIGEYGEKLNSFCRVEISSRAKELPYSEGTAKLFYDSMLALCHIADKLDAVLSNPEKVLEASGRLLLS